MFESGKWVKENKRMTSVLSTNTASCGKNFASDLRTLFRECIIEKFSQSELAMVQFTQRQVLLVYFFCFSLFSFIFS